MLLAWCLVSGAAAARWGAGPRKGLASTRSGPPEGGVQVSGYLVVAAARVTRVVVSMAWGRVRAAFTAVR